MIKKSAMHGVQVTDFRNKAKIKLDSERMAPINRDLPKNIAAAVPVFTDNLNTHILSVRDQITRHIGPSMLAASSGLNEAQQILDGILDDDTDLDSIKRALFNSVAQAMELRVTGIAADLLQLTSTERALLYQINVTRATGIGSSNDEKLMSQLLKVLNVPGPEEASPVPVQHMEAPKAT